MSRLRSPALWQRLSCSRQHARQSGGEFAAGLAIAALLVVCCITPFVLDQLTALRARADGSPIIVAPYAVFGELFPNWLRRLADVPGYWLIILPIELPAAYFAGLVGLMAALRSALPKAEKLAVAALACLAGTGLVISWLLASTFSGNNDLGLRAIIPAEIILIVSAATVLTMPPRRVGITVTALAGLALSLPDTAKIIRDNVAGKPKPDGRSLRANTRTLGDSASIRDAGRPRRQQSAVSQGPDTVAGKFVLGLACQPQLVFCRHRTSDPFCSAAAKAA